MRLDGQTKERRRKEKRQTQQKKGRRNRESLVQWGSKQETPREKESGEPTGQFREVCFVPEMEKRKRAEEVTEEEKTRRSRCSDSLLMSVLTRRGRGVSRRRPVWSRAMKIEKAKRSSFASREQTSSLRGGGSIGKTLDKDRSKSTDRKTTKKEKQGNKRGRSKYMKTTHRSGTNEDEDEESLYMASSTRETRP